MSLTDKTINNILVIGNGFDLHCGLPSTFSEYYSKECFHKVANFYNAFRSENYGDTEKLLKTHPDVINFWSFLFYVHYYVGGIYRIGKNENQNWFDIETLIRDALTLDIYAGFKLKDYIKDAFEALDKDKNIHRPQNRHIRENPYRFFPFNQQTTSRSVYDYLLDELHKFEQSFQGYLIFALDKGYGDRCQALLRKLVKDCDTVDLINFNYTRVDDNFYINRQTNVHGELYDEEIIIGIDSSSVTSDDLIKFTKTYRNIHRAKKPFELPDDVSRLIFYGHSLSDADFSYFHSLFDMYRLYDGALQLRFCYSDYKESKSENEMNHSNYVKQVYKLINEYSDKSHQDKNLLHRLLLEGRITVEKI